MKPPDLFAEDPNPSLAQLVTVCERFADYVSMRPKFTRLPNDEIHYSAVSDTGILQAAERLALQILASWVTLLDFSKAYSECFSSKKKLPESVAKVFWYASVVESASLPKIISELWLTYKGVLDESASIARKEAMAFSDSLLMKRPSLWNMEGGLKHNIYAFDMVYPERLTDEIANRIRLGDSGVETVYSAREKVNYEIRSIIDHELSLALDERLDELLVLFARELESSHIISKYSEYESIIKNLDNDAAMESNAYVIEKLSERLAHHHNDFDDFTEAPAGMQALEGVMEWMERKGGSVLDIFIRAHGDAQPPSLIAKMLGTLHDTQAEGVKRSTAGCVTVAGFRVLGDEFLANLDLDDEQMLSIFKLRGESPALRNRLLKSRQGREGVLSSDLGI